MPRLRAALALTLALGSAALAGLAPALDQGLRESKYVYVQSERKSGQFGTPAEIWFFYEEGKVYVGTRPGTWRVRRIKEGRKRARVAVGKADGPAFEATGELVHDSAVEQRLMEAYAKKYPEGWAKFEGNFREGFKSGERVLVRYTPR